MPPVKKEVIVGGHYGRLTILSEVGTNKYRQPIYRVRCSCGKIYETSKPIILKKDAKCVDCGRVCTNEANRKYRTGDVINGIKLLEKVGMNKHGGILYRCVCLRCGSESIRTAGSVAASKRKKCRDCPPDYNFRLEGDKAVGILPDGTEFVVDTDKADLVNRNFWRKDTKGYVVTGQGAQKILLQWFVMGYKSAPQNMVIDHINQDKTDNRLCNLRLVNVQQNNLNRGITKANKSGYVGAFFDSSKGRYCGKITFNNHGIRLGFTDDLIEAAQMYNIASELLFGEFAGHHNDVPEPTQELIARVTERCAPYLLEAKQIQKPVHKKHSMRDVKNRTSHFISA